MAAVTGTVTIDGQPAKGLEVSFNPKDPSLGTTAMGYTDASGNYSLSYPGGKTGAPVGEYSVAIVAAELDEEEGAKPVSIPAAYNTETTLAATVQSGENKIDFDLKSEGK